MKIEQLSIQGFRSLKDVIWQPGDLNVVIGPNGTGKSNLLRMLEFISAGAQGRLSKYVQSSGGIEALLWDGRAESITFQLQTFQDDRYDIAVNAKYIKGRKVYTLELVRVPFSSDYNIMDEFAGRLTESSELVELLVRNARKTGIFDVEEQVFLPSKQQIERHETLLSQTVSPFTDDIALHFLKSQFAFWTIYHDIRVDRSTAMRQPVVASVDERVDADGQNLINVLHTLYTGNREFKQSVNAAMRAAFGDDFDELIFPPASDQRVQLRVRWKTLQREQSAADLSDGTLRFLFLLAVLAAPNPAPLIAIDEPETGLHPSMLPIIAEYAIEASKRTQVIFTTHSDQFLDAFGDTRPTTTIAKWVDGETILSTLDGEELDYWLQEYSLGKLFRSGELEAMA